MIEFNKPAYSEQTIKYVTAAIKSGKLSGDGEYTKNCRNWFQRKLNTYSSLLVPNCTQALEMSAILVNINPGDEVIMPSYTFVSTANAFVLRGAVIVFVDIKPETMNIDENLIEAAITKKTKAIVPVHYAGISCEMDRINEIANKYNLYVIEDAAQGMMSEYKGNALGTLGNIGAYSFHETKNYSSGGEGGLIIINDEDLMLRSEIIREKGTNRNEFFLGMVDKYTWVDIGSSFLPSELQAAYLWGQLEIADEINSKRLSLWNTYHSNLQVLEDMELIKRPVIPVDCKHNAHMYYLKVRDIEQRSQLIEFLKVNGVISAFHYIPLHSSLAGKKFGRFNGIDNFTTLESEKLVRLPLWCGLPQESQEKVIELIFKFFVKNGSHAKF